MRLRIAFGLAVVALLLSACSGVLVFVGTGSSLGVVDYDLEFRAVLYGSQLRGSYYLFTEEGDEILAGTAQGTVTGTQLSMALFGEEECDYDFTGSITVDTLVGDYEPRAEDCGLPGSWDLQSAP